MCESSNEDNISIHSDDSITSGLMKNEIVINFYFSYFKYFSLIGCFKYFLNIILFLEG
jgi:hypothetical protein